MLIEMTSPVFKVKGKERPPIRFKEGLNVVLGKEDGENSIGKSSAMLAIDFAFGGNTYLDSDGVKHIGNHTIFFAFSFNGKPYYFARNTASPDVIHVCSEEYQLTGDVWTKHEFANWLKEKYHIDFAGLSFRETMSSFFRIYGKENTDERRPLKGLPGESMQKSIDILVKLFDRYKDVEVFNGRLEEQKKKLAAYREARKYRFVPDLVGGKTQYNENVAQIRSLQIELDNLTEEQVEDQKDVDIEKSRIKSQLQASKLRLETEMQSKQRRLSLLNMSLEYGLYPTEADLSALQEFFPEVNIRKLYEVEKYHQKQAAILAAEAEKGLRNFTGKATSTKLDKQIDYQQRINKAVDGLLNHFCHEVGLQAYYQEMAKAQAQVMSLLRVYEEADRSNSHEEFLYPKDVALFFCDICDLFDLLTTLDDIACDNSGE